MTEDEAMVTVRRICRSSERKMMISGMMEYDSFSIAICACDHRETLIGYLRIYDDTTSEELEQEASEICSR